MKNIYMLRILQMMLDVDTPKEEVYYPTPKKTYIVGFYEIKTRKSYLSNGKRKREKFLSLSQLRFKTRSEAVRFADTMQPLIAPFTAYSGGEVYEAQGAYLSDPIYSTIKKHLEE